MPILPATTVDFFLAGLESFMLQSGQGAHRAVTVLRLAGVPDAARLEASWRQIHADQPLIGARLKRLWRGWRLVWEADGMATAPAILWHPPQDVPPSDEVIGERLQGRRGGEIIHAPLSLEVFPCDEECMLLLTWRHALLDGSGVNLLLERLAEGGGGAEPLAPVQRPREGAGVLLKRALPLMKRLHTMTRVGCLSAWDKGMSFGKAPAFRLIELTEEESQVAASWLRRCCGDFMQMPFYAAIAARSMRLIHQQRGWRSPEIHLQLPFQPRGRGRDLIFGNHMSTLPLFLDAGAMGTLSAGITHVMEKYREAMKQGMPQASEAMMSLAAYLPARWFVPVVRMSNRGQICSLFHSHTGAFMVGKDDFAGAEVRNVYTIPSVCAPPGVGLFFSECRGRITATLSWRDGVVSMPEVNILCGQIRGDLVGAMADNQ